MISDTDSGRHGPVWRVLDGTKTSPPPIWLMRQAGRYLPEYRKIRAEAGSFLDLCYNPKLASDVTLQPIERFDFDAAILFSDILVIPDAMGQRVRFATGEGPLLDPIEANGVAALRVDGVVERLSPVLETVSRVRARLSPAKTLIGFCGAPWTVATYMIAGRGTPDQAPARLFAERHREAFADLIERLVSASVAYLIAQIRAGADVVQVFDSWSGVLGEKAFQRWCIAPMKRIVDEVRHAAPQVRIIGFPKGAGLMLERYVAETGVDGVSIDWTTPLGWARQALQPRVAVQGNLDPLLLIGGGDALLAEVDRIVAELGGGRLVFNLGHGIRPETPVENVAAVVQRVRSSGAA
ncbi:MAG: uroporphyrinogen decarboxylase [Alphaproteobacteria bacterium]